MTEENTPAGGPKASRPKSKPPSPDSIVTGGKAKIELAEDDLKDVSGGLKIDIENKL